MGAREGSEDPSVRFREAKSKQQNKYARRRREMVHTQQEAAHDDEVIRTIEVIDNQHRRISPQAIYGHFYNTTK